MDKEALAARGIRVRDLEWEQSLKGRWIGTPPAKLSDLAFWVFLRSGGYIRHVSGQGVITYPTLEAAKAAAQADYETRILAALEMQDDK